MVGAKAGLVRLYLISGSIRSTGYLSLSLFLSVSHGESQGGEGAYNYLGR